MRYASSKSPGKGNKARGGGQYAAQDAGGRTKSAGSGGRHMTHSTGVKPTRTTKGRTAGNVETNRMNPFKAAKC